VGEKVAATSFVVTGLTSGVIYQFKVKSRNSHSLSADSSSITLLSVYSPDPPESVTTENVNADVRITWSEPNDNGLSVTGYQIYIAGHDGVTYSQETANCASS
jgi:hypothetical protein